MHRLLTIITTLLLSLTAMAQRYPVTVSPVLLPPYTLNLSELTAQGSAKMMATLTVNDLTAVNLPVRLHFKLESAGITVENIPTSAVAPLFLNGGETQILTGTDMAQYLRLDNLEFRGYSKDSYRQTGQLPGGLWKVTIEVRHFHTGRVLSNRGAQTLWVSIYDPPVLTAPRNNTEAPDNPSLPLVFSWQASKHTGGTVAVQYKLELWEMRMEGVPAQTVAASMTPIFETTTTVTSYTAIPTGMDLEPGMRYCWRVTVFDPSGQAQINKNGQSEVREFTYLHTCPAVDEVTATVRNTQADFSWTPSPYHTHFRVEMLQEGGSSDVSDCYDSKFRLYDFPQGTTWRVRVRGECKGDLEADWSPWTDFSIDPPGTPPTNDECPDCGCDDGPAKREIENYELKELQPGDTIVNRTGRTRFIVLSANATGDRIYSGQFYLWLELWKTKVRCDYTDLKVNTDGVILDGSWRSVHNDGLMVNPATVAENIQNIREGIANATFDNTVRDTIKLGYAVQTIYKDENGRYIAILEDGSEHDLTQDLSTANKTMIEDSQGNKMVVTGDQQLMSAEQYHNTGKNNTLIKSDNERKDKQIAASGDVIFKPSGNQQYGFDAYDASTNNHPEIYPPLEGGRYRPAYKSVAQWQQDKVAADPMQGVTFRNQMGAPYATTSGDIILRGEPQPGETPVYAHMAETDSTTKVVGKLNLLTFEPREISVCLVPVNGATPPNAQTLEKELNKIFKSAVASVKVSTHSGITIDYADGSGFVHGGSGPLTVYSDDEKAAINALTDANDDTYYLFLVKNVTKLDADGNNTVVSGYMPVGYQHGFIFEQFDVARTIAHELSHGAFALHHTFSANTESFRADEGTTNNLMDYTEHGIALNHKQWRWMHENHGKGLFGFLADEESGEMSIFKSYFSLVHYMKPLEDNTTTAISLKEKTTLYFLPQIKSAVTLCAKQQKEDKELENVKVNWSISTDTKNIEEYSFVVDNDFFGEKTQVQLDVTEKVILGEDVTLTYYISKIDINIKDSVKAYLNAMIDLKTNFDNTRKLLRNIDKHADTISLLLDSSYFDCGLNKYYEKPGVDDDWDDWSKNLRKLYEYDIIKNTYGSCELFEKLVEKAGKIVSDDSQINTFVENLTAAIKLEDPIVSETENTETDNTQNETGGKAQNEGDSKVQNETGIKAQYVNQIKDLTLKNLKTLIETESETTN